MRVGLMIYGSLNTVSGGYLYDRKLVEVLKNNGHQVEIIALPWRNYFLHLLDNFSGSLLNRLQNLHVDFLIQDELNHPSFFYINSRIHRNVNYRIISLIHHLRSSEQHPPIWMPFYRFIEKQYLTSVDGWIFNSRTTAGVVKNFTGKNLPSVIAFPAGDRLPVEISEAQIVTRSNQAGPIRILFLGNVIPRKGLHTLLHALERLEQQAWELTVVGSLDSDADYARKMQSFVLKNHWEAQVTFTGPISDEGLLPIFNRSQVLALPSQYEGFGIAYLEGMGAGLPAIASNGGAAHELVQNGVNGFLVRPGDHVALASRLIALTEDRDLLTRMGKAALETYQAHPTWEQSMQRTNDFLVNFDY